MISLAPNNGMRHAPFAIGIVERDRWLQLMNRALDQASLPADVTQILRAFFASTADFLVNRAQG
jgi:hemoglobin